MTTKRIAVASSAFAVLICGCTMFDNKDAASVAVALSEPDTNGVKTVKVINFNPEAKPIRNVEDSTCAPIMGYAGSLEGDDAKTFFEKDREGTARAFRLSGARFVRQWDAVNWWQVGAGARLTGKAGDPKNPVRIANPEQTTDMKNVFSFYKEYGIKVSLTLENYSVITNSETYARSGRLEDVQRVICDYVKWIVDNNFTDVVGALELGNEPYWAGASMFAKDPQAPENYAAKWTPIVIAIKKIWPQAPIGMTIAEYMKGDPDIGAVRNRMLSSQELKPNDYFDDSSLSQWSGRYIVAMSNALPHISHVIHHAYGAETPYSATYSGVQRFRNFAKAFPEIKGKKFWITEWRDRSDEDNRSHQRFYNTLTKSGYMMMMVAQDDVDGMNLHQFTSLSGAFYAAIPGGKDKNGRFKDGTWACNWDGRCNWRPNYDDIGVSYLEPGGMGPAMRLMVETLRREPVVMDFGSEKYGAYSEGCSNAVWSCSDYYNSIFHGYSKAYAQGKTGSDLPKIGDDCEYLVTMNKQKSYLSIIAVNYKSEETQFALKLPKFWKAMSPDYRVYDCPAEYLCAHEVPGEPRFTRRYGYQPLYPQPCGPYIIRIPANSLTTVRIPIERRNLYWAAKDLIDEALTLEKQGGVQFCVYKNGKCILDVYGGHLSTNQGARAVTSDSLFPIFSSEKPLLATAVHRAVEKGKMDYDKPLCTWWPEFAGKGKENLTLRETLAYRSGMNGGRPKAFKSDIELCDWQKTLAAAAAEAPEVTPGTKQRYMPRAYAWMLGHPLEVAMGKPLNDVLTEEILIPAGITNEFYFVAGEAESPRIATFYKSKYCEVMNNSWARKACLPSSWAVASARSLAMFYNRLCGFDGREPLIKKETLDNALKPSRHASDPLPPAERLNDDWHMIFGLGYGLWGEFDRMGRVFGHGGAGGSEALVDRDNKLVVAFTCNFEDPYTYKKLRKDLYELVDLRWRYWKEEADIQTLQMRTSGK